MRINEDYLDDIDVKDIVSIENEPEDFEEEGPFDFTVSIMPENYEGDCVSKDNVERRLEKFLDACPFIIKHSRVERDEEKIYQFSMCHNIRTSAQIMRFVTGLFKIAGPGQQNAIRIYDLNRQDTQTSIPWWKKTVSGSKLYFYFLDTQPYAKDIWWKAAKLCMFFLPDNKFTVEQIADSIPGYNTETLYEQFLVNYKREQFEETNTTSLESLDGTVIDWKKISFMFKERPDEITYIQFLTYVLVQGRPKIYTETIPDDIMDQISGRPMRFCTDVQISQTHSLFIAYTGSIVIDCGRGEEPFITALCIKYDNQKTNAG